MISFFKYVRHADIPAHEALGWVFEATLAHHGAYSVLMRWAGEGEPK